MGKHDAQHAAAIQFTEDFRNTIKSDDFWGQYFSQRSSFAHYNMLNHVAPGMAPYCDIAYRPRAAKPWTFRYRGAEIISYQDADDVQQALGLVECRTFQGKDLGDALLTMTKKIPVELQICSRTVANILGQHAPYARVFIARAYDELQETKYGDTFQAIGRESHGLHDLQSLGLSFSNGLLGVYYQWNDGIYHSFDNLSIRGQLSPTLLQALEGNPLREYFELPFVADTANITRAVNYSTSIEISYKDEMKTIGEWIADGIL